MGESTDESPHGNLDSGQDGTAERVSNRVPVLVFGGALFALIAAVAAVVVIFRASGLAEAEVDWPDFAGSETSGDDAADEAAPGGRDATADRDEAVPDSGQATSAADDGLANDRPSEGAERVNLYSYEPFVDVGECVFWPELLEGEEELGGPAWRVDCDQPHHAQLAAVVPLEGAEFPGEALAWQRGTDACVDAVLAYRSKPLPPALEWMTWTPTDVAWWSVSPAAECWIVGEWTGSLRTAS